MELSIMTSIFNFSNNKTNTKAKKMKNYFSDFPFDTSLLFNYVKYSTIILLFKFSFCVNAAELTIDEIRNEILNKQITILDNQDSTPSSWYLVTGDETTGFKKSSSNRNNSNVAKDFRGKQGVVVYIVKEPSKFFSRSKSTDKDIFGAKIDESQEKNPYINIVVKMSDSEQLIGTTNFYSNLDGRDFQSSTKLEIFKNEIERELSLLMGKDLYYAGFTQLFDVATNIDILRDINKRKIYKDNKIENLTKLKVVDTKFLEPILSVALKVELPNGEYRLIFGDLRNYNTKYGFKPTQLERMDISAVEKIPSEFTKEELKAIRTNSIFRGMSVNALSWSWGYYKSKNDWGKGGDQIIFENGQYVYTDGKKIRDWQNIK